MIYYLLLFCALIWIQPGLAISINIRGIQRNLCFKFKAEVNEEVVFSYLVSGINDQSISAKILDPNSQIMFKSNVNSREGKLHHVVNVGGKFQICFDSLDKSAKSISFDMVKTLEVNGVAMEDELDHIRNQLRLLEVNLNIANQHLEFKKKRSKVYTQILTDTEGKLLNYSLIKIGILIITTLIRAYILTKSVSGSGTSRV